MIAIIDYGVGNLRSVQKGYEKAGIAAFVTTNPDEVVTADAVVLPGVGAFADAADNLKKTGMEAAVFEVVRQKKLLIGVCLGMQLMMSESEENGIHRGLGLIEGRVVRFPAGRKVPHMGWNQVQQHGSSPIFKGVPDLSYYYFVHSYYCCPDDPAVTAGTCEYGLDFCCAVQKDNIFGVQFHPEKSSERGLHILKNFGEMLNK